ncbi:MAG: anti-sigma factor antagonist [Planctomycetota bacterium]|nr:MAG: anti-sigma factor antagonist [Planctomycetota bacterium]
MSDEKIVIIEPQEDVILAVVDCVRMEEEHTQMMQEEVSAAAEQSRQLPVVLDLSKVEFVPSLSLGALVNLLREFKQHNQRFILAGLHPDVRGTLAVTRLDKLFEITNSVDEALAQVRKSS